MTKPQMVEDADLGRIYAFCQPDPEIYSILRRLVSYGTAPDVTNVLGSGGRSFAERLKDAEKTVPGDVWVHRKNGRTAQVLGVSGRTITIKHQLGKVSQKWYSYLASDFDLRVIPGAIR